MLYCISRDRQTTDDMPTTENISYEPVSHKQDHKQEPEYEEVDTRINLFTEQTITMETNAAYGTALQPLH